MTLFDLAAAEDLILMKEAALADDPSRPQDQADIHSLKSILHSARRGQK